MNKRSPKVSIVTPSYNQGNFIEATILSILNQSYHNIEYILVDGGSTDHTMEIVEQYRGKIDIVIYENGNGRRDIINKGFKLATGELAGWVNAGDILYADCVEEMVKLYLNDRSLSICYSSSLHHINITGEITGQLQTIINSPNDLLKYSGRINQPGAFFNVEILRRVYFLDETIHYAMGIDLWLKLLNHGAIAHFDKHSLSASRICAKIPTNTGIKFYNEMQKTIRRFHTPPADKNFIRLRWHTLKWLVKSV